MHVHVHVHVNAHVHVHIHMYGFAGYVCCTLLLDSPLMVVHHVEPCCHCWRLSARWTFRWCLCLIILIISQMRWKILRKPKFTKFMVFSMFSSTWCVDSWPMSVWRRCFWRMDHHCWMIGDSATGLSWWFPGGGGCSAGCNAEEIALQCETIDSSRSWSESYAKCWISDVREKFQKPLPAVMLPPRCCQVVSHGQQLLSRLFGMPLSRTCRLPQHVL